MKQRIVTGLVAGLGFFIMLYLGGYWFAGLIVALALIGYDEFLRMNGLNRNRVIQVIGYIGVVVLTLPWQFGFMSSAQGIWLFLFLFLAATVITKNKTTIDHVATAFLGMAYVGLGFHYMIETRTIPDHGLFLTLLVFLCIWTTDSGAYFTGSMIGKTPLWPTISPKKSVEGAIGGTVLSVIVAIGFAWCRPDLLGYAQAVWIGLVIAVVGQVGDLVQSAYKRVKGIKDSGMILPGHGGVLDRTDSWLIVFPFLHVVSLIPHV
ncbi:phosphatidate cytidylyltransferase [Paenibacillus validus]|uniref:Phosphatidate cytidylyltransferase n=1 Tax=Paenibacillus validus TaxID=44253 RepID=A0A7X2ZA72_9BACL|nr:MULTISPECIES: phosphatidate cytidylyltransferase [Paenibacillus]MED4602717.1 phosphatidate cytidylyltransferase [Paenibacillus validus]MED4607146.1 phosphatidate cytidylyltransferase [Paenibacillus validus]MUG70493.1 phosphatidate cytidylyltransferase [Paenibacillus validus]